MSGVRVIDVSKSFDGTPVVDHVSLDIADGEFVVLVGPSGCGKTTTLRMIAGLEDVSAGRIHIGARDVTDLHPKDRNVAMVFQSYALYPHKTVAENMGFALRIAKRPKAEIAARVGEAARILGLSDYLERRPAALSGGQRQRVAVGRAIVRDPEVFLFDEPLSNLDAKLRTTMRSELIKLHHSLKATMVYVTHDQIEAMTMGDRIVVMDGGRVQQIGTPLDVYDNPINLFVASFIGSPAMNVFTVAIEAIGDGVRALIGDQALDLPADHPAALARRAVLGIRPEFLTFDPAPGDARLTATIDAIEHLGAETLVDFSVGDARGVAKTGRNERLVRGSQTRLGVAPARILAFDPESGARLRGRS
ncbi:MAG: sn-glycerol-3-phosphate ABC transporter ATP-binding protein UgpC [Alphaproteobacteria bacterium]|nr:sn-glycerol-3-phosphate ABC transporter ATP-binding protein UgpC [Alphaproteobacteria bacterium]